MKDTPILNLVLRATAVWISAGAAILPTAVQAQRQMESLGRGVAAMRTGTSSAYVGWRLLGTDPADTKFNLYRVTGGVTNLVAANVTNSCNFVDNGAAQASAHAWFVQPILNGATQANSAVFYIPAAAPAQQYINIPLSAPPGGVSYDGAAYTYTANDCSAGDVDGDGEYEIILKWDPSNSHDSGQTGFTGDTYLDCYKLDGARLWRIDLGPNIRSGAHYEPFMVYDFDGDGKAEVMCRTAPGSIDGSGHYVGSAAKWQNANGPRPSFNDTDDYRFSHPGGVTNGMVLAGPEFLTVFNGLTGQEMATATYFPKRDPDNNYDNPTTSRIDTIWGDDYGNRIDRFLAGVTHCDGVRPSGIFCRGYYTRAYLAAWDWRNGALSVRWTFASDPSNTSYRGQGAHCLTVGDADGDGKDEITYGACAINHNGTGLYSTGLGHGDALHMSDMDPARPGLEVWMVHESPASYGAAGLELRDAKTGALILGVDGQNSDVGRGVAYDIDPRYRGYEMWGARGGLMSATGIQISSTRPNQMNFCAWWDADTLRESLDGTTIYKWDWANSVNNSVFSPAGVASNNSTKATPCLSADLFGDWREEVVWRTSDNLNLRIYTTTILATNRLYTLMHDPQYRCAIAWQNTGYNQPPHPGFFLGYNMYPPPLAPASAAQLAWRGSNGGNVWNAASNWFVNGIWTSDIITNFISGSSVLFDLRAATNATITLPAAVSSGDITVHSPSDFTFVGSGGVSGTAKLFKAGPGRLTLANTNTFAGGAFVSGGQLIVNGALTASPVIVEARGEPWGCARIGGSGQLGQGLTVQAGCGVIVGPGTNAPGTFTVTNGLTELGGVLNQFDLSGDPASVAGSNDLLRVFGNLALAGTNTIEVTQTSGSLGGGVYPLITYTGTLTGGVTNLVVTGAFLQPVSLTNSPGMIGLLAVVPAAPPSAPSSLLAMAVGAFQINLTWRDNSADENALLIERSAGGVGGFAQIAAVGPNVTNYFDIGLAANTTYYYRVRGTNLAGFSAYSNTNSATTTATPPSLTWKGDGALNVWDIATTSNWLQGATRTLYADGAFVTFDNTGSSSPNIYLSTNLRPGSLTVAGTKSYTFGGIGGLAGAMTFTKSGTGVITLTTTNTYSGGTVISNGTVALSGSTFGGYTANTYALGSGPVTLRGGTLRMFGHLQSDNTTGYGPLTNDLVIPAGQSGTLGVPPRGTMGSRVTGSGTLTLAVDYVRGDVGGDWTGFTGQLNVVPTTGTPNSGTVDDFRVTTTSGFPNTKLSLTTNLLMYSRASANSVIPIGQFSAGLGTTVSAGFGTSAGTQSAVTWRVGGLNSDATNAALFQGTTSLIKDGTGKWTLTGDNTYTGTTTVNGGTLVVNGNQSAATGNVTVNANGTLAGNGVIGGNTTINGRLAPGANGIGALTFTGNLTLTPGSTMILEISKNPFANDQVVIGGTVNYEGTLDVVNVSPDLLQAGDNFQLFSASATTGASNTFNLPALDQGLAWNTSRLAVDGRLWVVSTYPPVFSSAVRSNAQLVLSGQGGTPGWDYQVLASTNAALPVALWMPFTTNQFDNAGDFSFTVPITSDPPRQFFRLLAP